MSLLSVFAPLHRLRPRALSHKNKLLLAAALVTATATTALLATAPRHDPSVVEEKVWPVSAVAVERSYEAPELQLFGRVETPRHARISSAVGAEVIRVHVSEGQQVRAGDPLVSLDAEEQELQLRQREAELMESESSLAALEHDFATELEVLEHMQHLLALTRAKAERLQTLYGKQLIATEQLENIQQEVARQGIEVARQQALVNKHPQRLRTARAELQRARARYDDQQRKLDQTELRAPFDGRISGLSAAPGDRIQAGATLLSLYDNQALQLRVPLPTAAAATLKQALQRGDTITATLAAGQGSAELLQLASEIERGASGGVAIFALPSGSGAMLELGKAVDLRVRLPEVGPVLALPMQSLYENRRIYLVQGERLQGVDVAPLGTRHNALDELEVLIDATALPASTRVLSSDLPAASSGLRVEVVNAREPGIAASTDGPASPAG
ncbi:efflux RND transporter periplasmic adaptor subunit [Kineobactrum salinum]|uniref:Biotin/lipoyl-binding protein n=1 Tax=Kineobactrum salinum TaxID=2708301 RepID=A0A6C0U6U9_9GAMM|nr:biotin/lipoyl-binding protein [Kineobactrum salinum]QIB66667.1 biotin/lipoyl-binding protein [Kineobactrum salinum]